MRSRPRLFVAIAIALACEATAARATAQDKAAAEAIFDEGRKLAASQNYRAACERFEESERLEPAPGTLLNLADCYEKTGRVASAWAALLEAAARSDLAGEKQRADSARARAGELASALSRLRVITPEPGLPAGAEVTRDGVVVGRGEWGVAIPVDSGPHVVGCRSPGAPDWSETVEVPPGSATVDVTVPMPHVAVAPTPATTSQVARVPALPLLATPAAASRSGTSEVLRTVGWTAGALGAAGLIAAATAGVGAVVEKSGGRDDTALRWARAFDLIALPSALTLATGLTLLVLTPVPARPAPTSSVMPPPARADVGVVMTQAF